MNRIKPVLAVAAIVLPCLVANSARADVSILDNDKNVDVDCAKDPKISLLGNHLTIHATGVCASLQVMGNESSFTGSAAKVSIPGNHNTITLIAVDDVSVTGNYNTVTVRKPLKRKTPNISNTGNQNSVSQ